MKNLPSLQQREVKLTGQNQLWILDCSQSEASTVVLGRGRLKKYFIVKIQSQSSRVELLPMIFIDVN